MTRATNPVARSGCVLFDWHARFSSLSNTLYYEDARRLRTEIGNDDDLRKVLYDPDAYIVWPQMHHGYIGGLVRALRRATSVGSVDGGDRSLTIGELVARAPSLQNASTSHLKGAGHPRRPPSFSG